MIFTETSLRGAYVIDLAPVADERGFFARTFCQREFRAHGLDGTFVQCNLSYNRTCGTLRGMHYQAAPHEEAKVVACLRGAVYDAIIDLRPRSQTFRAWTAIELSEHNRRMLYVPKGFAHGFQTLADDTEVFYLMSAFYDPDSARGVRWDDPAFGIAWPETLRRMVSARDEAYPLFEEKQSANGFHRQEPPGKGIAAEDMTRGATGSISKETED
ncbi:MAG: dTDP-4-dehydrorhamnose 3,5-epimerase [Desulfomonile tiedjei]|nr:dTDP-4-dehydrorhamnose 3,5-epimerase [Desulfomonile tiedjei]